jgi:Siphovirus protein of unknown function (DUF859)
MALSGSYYKNVGDHWRLQVEWSASQSISGNYSNVTAKLYWIARDGYGAIYSTANKTAAIRMNGGTYDTVVTDAALKGNQKRLIHSKTLRVDHAADGKGSITLDAYFDAEVTLSGTWYGRIDMDSRTFTLNTIPRASSVSSSANWTAGSSLSMSISRAASSFTHTAKIYVNGVLIRTETGITTSRTVNFTVAENTTIFEQLAQGATQDTEIELITYSGGTNIGTKSKTGTVTAPYASTLDLPDSINIGDTLNGGITRKDSEFVHDVRLYYDDGTYFDFMDEGGTGFSYDTDGIKDKLYAQAPNSKVWEGRIAIWTHYNGVQVRDRRDYYVDFKVTNSNPIYNGGMTYKDDNAATVAITGDEKSIIQGVSTVLVTIPAATKATAQNGATMKTYTATLNGVSKTVNYSGTADVTIDFNQVNAAADISLTVKAVDSRGNSTSKSMTVKMIPYSAPAISFTADRENSFENSTLVDVKGSYSPLLIGGVDKNSIQALTYSFRKTNVSTSEGSGDVPKVIKNGTFTGRVTLDLNNLSQYYVEVQVKDILNTVTVNITVPVGQPIFYIDEKNRSMGFNDFPIEAGTFFMNGRLIFGSNMYASGGGENGAGAAFFNNSDITGLNGIFFMDKADNNGEGLQFLKTGKPTGSIVREDYDNFRILDGMAYINGKPVLFDGDRVLWTGKIYPQGNATITIPKALSACPRGWILVWSDFDADTGIANDFNFMYHFIPKEHITMGWGGKGVMQPIPVGNNNPEKTENKYIYVNDTTIAGHDDNRTTPDGVTLSDSVLRAVLVW